jgi:isopentenyl diphosphate isomerase/L-lactate dehydrogenase-like FMN-dependent dehydrogenase
MPGGTAPQPGRPVKVDDFEALAREKLPLATFEYISTGSADEVTRQENVAAERRLKLLPPLLHGVSCADPFTKVLGQSVKLATA